VERVRVEWDEAKNEANKRKHGVSFESVAEMFAPEADYLQIFDPEHSTGEDRFISLGLVRGGVVMVVTTEPEDAVIRIISARRATRREARFFAEFMGGREP
jgi:uncharacterized DUF497 family protein